MVEFRFQHDILSCRIFSVEIRQDAVLGNFPEGFDFPFPFYNKAYRNGLYTSRRESCCDFPPQDGRQFKSDDSVQHPPCLLCVNKVIVYVTRMQDGFLYGRFGDFVEDDAMCILVFKVQDFMEMPCDGFPFAVFIACQPNGVGFFHLCSQLIEQMVFLGFNYIIRLIVVVEVNTRAILPYSFNIPDMTLRRHDMIVRSEELFYRLCLGGRLNYYKVFTHILFLYQILRCVFGYCFPNRLQRYCFFLICANKTRKKHPESAFLRDIEG